MPNDMHMMPAIDAQTWMTSLNKQLGLSLSAHGRTWILAWYVLMFKHLWIIGCDHGLGLGTFKNGLQWVAASFPTFSTKLIPRSLSKAAKKGLSHSTSDFCPTFCFGPTRSNRLFCSPNHGKTSSRNRRDCMSAFHEFYPPTLVVSPWGVQSTYTHRPPPFLVDQIRQARMDKCIPPR